MVLFRVLGLQLLTKVNESDNIADRKVNEAIGNAKRFKIKYRASYRPPRSPRKSRNEYVSLVQSL